MFYFVEWTSTFLTSDIYVGVGDTWGALRADLFWGSSERASDNVGQTDVLPLGLRKVDEASLGQIYSPDLMCSFLFRRRRRHRRIARARTS